MQEMKDKSITLPAVDPRLIAEFDLTSPGGREFICDQIKADIAEFSKQYFTEQRRGYLGASQLGHPCDLYLWRTFRWQKERKYTGRELRLFNTGHREEAMFILYLRGIGFKVEEIDPNTNKQYRAYYAHKHGSGSCDGVGAFPERYQIKNCDRLLFEFKTSKTGAAFNNLPLYGVEKEKYQHWVQMCVYGESFNIDYALYITNNKNDDDHYYEVAALDRFLGRSQLDRGTSIISQQTPPRKIQANSMIPPCKFCEFAGICFKGEIPDKNCRSCSMASPVVEGQWHCSMFNATIPVDFIPVGCDHWRSIG